MRVSFVSIFVNDQQKALDFYSKILGFVVKVDEPAGKFRWITLASADDPEGAQITLEPNATSVARDYQKGLYESGIPATSFEVNDIEQEFSRLSTLGVKFKLHPQRHENISMASFEDTVGNYVQMHQTHSD